MALAGEGVVLDDRAAAEFIVGKGIEVNGAAGGAFHPLPVGIVEIALDDGGTVLDLFGDPSGALAIEAGDKCHYYLFLSDCTLV